MRLCSWPLPPEARGIGSPVHCFYPFQQDEMTCQQGMAANKRMKPTMLSSLVLKLFSFFRAKNLACTINGWYWHCDPLSGS